MDITATLGPASLKPEILSELSKRVSRFRLNSGHLDTNTLRSILKQLDGSVPVVIDLQGAKVRIGKFVSVDELPERVKIINADFSDDAGVVPLPDEQFFKALKKDDRIFLNDARIELEIRSVNIGVIDAIVVKNGDLSSFKSINRKEHPVRFIKVGDADKRTIGVSVRYDFVEYAISFIHNGEEAKLYRPIVRDKKLIAKVERPEAMLYLENINKNFDEIWFCRGDMGTQAGLENLNDIQKEFESRSNMFYKPKVVAGRIPLNDLNAMCELKNSVYNGIVLSDETAIGPHPLKVLELLSNIF